MTAPAPFSDADRAAAMAAIVAGDDVPTVWDAFAEAMSACGFPRLLYGCLPSPNAGTSIDLSEALMLHRGPTAFLDAYLDEELYRHSPMVDWSMRHDGFASNEEAVRDMTLVPSPQLMRIAQLRMEYQSGLGWIGGFRDVVPGVIGGIALHAPAGTEADAVRAAWARHGRAVAALARAAHLRLATLPHPVRRPLSSRQREVLDWASRGKSMQDTGTILGLSEQTVEKHLRLAREALNAANTAEAVRKALRHNLLRA